MTKYYIDGPVRCVKCFKLFNLQKGQNRENTSTCNKCQREKTRKDLQKTVTCMEQIRLQGNGNYAKIFGNVHFC